MAHHCEVCDETFADKYIQARHNSRPTHKSKLVEFVDMAELKKLKTDAREKLLERLMEYQKDKDFSVYQIIRIIKKEELLKPNSVKATVQDCERDLENAKKALLTTKLKVDASYTIASDIEKLFFKSLSHKNPGLAEGINDEGIPVAGQPAYYNLSVGDLLEIKQAMQARVEYIDYEVTRRSKEPHMDALNFIVQMFKADEADLVNPQTQESSDDDAIY